jgi:coniferyl-aldehyde dehydrogenase
MTADILELTENKKHVQQLNRVFSIQQQAFRNNPMPSLQERKDHLRSLKKAILKFQTEIIDAINEDFSNRSADETLLAEIMPSVQNINHAIKNLAKWMAPSKRHVNLLFQPASNKIYYQPLGVVGIIVPWNYPIFLALGPLIGALAAGNRATIKMSEYTPITGELFARIISETFPEHLVSVVNGDADVAVEFSRKPWNHLLFTGSTSVGRHVMRAASENLTPVTLELGGKSPAIIATDVPMKDAAERIAFGKAFNVGQTCVAPDYVLCPSDRIEEFVEHFQASVATMYPTLKDNKDYTSVIDERQKTRLAGYLEDAKQKGAKIIEVNPANEDMSKDTRKMSIQLVLNPTDKMKVMQDEIFGPILNVIAYDQIDDAIKFITDRPHPLAMYYFGYDKAAQDYVIQNTHAGGMCINDVLIHVAQDDMPFGGVGDSGMGHYHGEEGFRTFSNAKGVYAKQRFNAGKVIYAPHATLLHKIIYSLFVR